MSDNNKGCLIVMLIAVAIPIAALALFVLKVHIDTDRRIIRALNKKYRSLSIVINHRQEGGYNSVCFDIDLYDAKTGHANHRFAMVNGDSDGGVWTFGGEYPSMNSCVDHISRG